MAVPQGLITLAAEWPLWAVMSVAVVSLLCGLDVVLSRRSRGGLLRAHVRSSAQQPLARRRTPPRTITTRDATRVGSQKANRSEDMPRTKDGLDSRMKQNVKIQEIISLRRFRSTNYLL